MKRCYSVSTDKGGSGKTTTVVCLAAALAERGTPVLVLDLDRQASASKWFGCEADGDELGELLQAGGDLETLVQPSASAGVDCVPSGPLMLRADEIDTQTAAGHLKAAVAALNARRWRYLLIDCPPSLGALTLAAMASSAGVVVPVAASAMALGRVGAAVAQVDVVREGLNPRLRIVGLVVCQAKPRTLIYRDVRGMLEEQFGELVFDTAIRDSVRLAEAPYYREPITTYNTTGTGAEDYRALAVEFERRVS